MSYCRSEALPPPSKWTGPSVVANEYPSTLRAGGLFTKLRCYPGAGTTGLGGGELLVGGRSVSG